MDTYNFRPIYARMPRGGDEIQQSVHPVVPEPGVTPDPGFFRKDVVVLTFQVANNLLKSVKR